MTSKTGRNWKFRVGKKFIIKRIYWNNEQKLYAYNYYYVENSKFLYLKPIGFGEELRDLIILNHTGYYALRTFGFE